MSKEFDSLVKLKIGKETERINAESQAELQMKMNNLVSRNLRGGPTIAVYQQIELARLDKIARAKYRVLKETHLEMGGVLTSDLLRDFGKRSEDTVQQAAERIHQRTVERFPDLKGIAENCKRGLENEANSIHSRFRRDVDIEARELSLKHASRKESNTIKESVRSHLTDEQAALLELLVQLYRSGRNGEFIISRTMEGSGLVFADHGENVSIDFDDSDFLALQHEGLLHLHRDGHGDFHAKITGQGLNSVEYGPDMNESQPINKRNVFVIYGRNEKVRAAMFDFLRSLDLNPLEWGELIAKTKSAAPYIGQALEVGFNEAAAVICILTPDDLAFLHPALLTNQDKDHERKPSPQARPNVLFELGMAFALHPDRTVIVQIGELRPFSDVAGRHVIHFDGTPAARTELRNRLKNAGCDVKEHGTDWLTRGDFAITIDLGFEVTVEGVSALTHNVPLSSAVPITEKDWRDIRYRFERLLDRGILARWVDGATGVEFSIESKSSEDCLDAEALCRNAGMMLGNSPRVFKSLSDDVKSETDYLRRWLRAIKEREPVAYPVTGRSGDKEWKGGGIGDLMRASVRACTDWATLETA